MTRDRILTEIRAAAIENKGRPLGARAFEAATGIYSHTSLESRVPEVRRGGQGRRTRPQPANNGH